MHTYSYTRGLRVALVVVVAPYLEYSDAAADDNIVTDVLHDAGGLAGDEGQQYRRFVQIPEEKELPAGGCRAANVTEEVGSWVPKDSLEAEHNLRM